MPEKITLPLVINQSQKEKLRFLAKKQDCSMSLLAREALEDLFTKYDLTELVINKNGDNQK